MLRFFIEYISKNNRIEYDFENVEASTIESAKKDIVRRRGAAGETVTFIELQKEYR